MWLKSQESDCKTNAPKFEKKAGADMQIETITFGQAEIRSADDPQMIRHLSADDLPLIRRRSAAHPQRVCSSGANGRDLPDSTGHPLIPFMDAKITRENLAKFEVGTFEDDL
ncbi:hypothetical protein B0H13DRAFT_1863777 [Mycena leptocephala]|nr:hypothetical protein B0H13DRAFT_1863777 [Mycena leptocephala]